MSKRYYWSQGGEIFAPSSDKACEMIENASGFGKEIRRAEVPLVEDPELYEIAKKHGEPVDEPGYCGGNLLYALNELRSRYEKLLQKP